MAERSESKSTKRSFASKIKIRDILTRSFASRFQLRYAQPLLTKLKWSTYPQRLIYSNFINNLVILKNERIFWKFQSGNVNHDSGSINRANIDREHKILTDFSPLFASSESQQSPATVPKIVKAAKMKSFIFS